MSLSITILGASGTYPAPGTACSGYLLSTATTTVWLDCGSGSLANLQRHVHLGDIDGIICSHEHPDHWVDLPIALNALRYGLALPDAGIPLYWTAGTATMFDAVRTRPPRPTLVPTVIDERAEVAIGDIDFRFSRTDHPVETLAVRATAAGRSIVYSADTGNDWELSSLAGTETPAINLAVIEATLDEDTAGEVPHLSASQAGAQAERAGVEHLVLTHLAPGSDPAARLAAAEEVFDGPVAVAAVGDTYTA